MSGVTTGPALHGALDRFGGDDGSADPAVAAALAAFAAAAGSEHAVLTALAASRLLVPVVAAPADGAAVGPPAAGRTTGEKVSEMALPALVGQDGRRALPAFTSVAALAAWQPSARPVPAETAQVCRAAVEDSCAVIIDVAGPVPLAVEGARLAALAAGEPVPEAHADPDIRADVAAIIAGAAEFALLPGADGGDLVIELAMPETAQDAAARIGAAVMGRLGARLRRGIALAVVPPE